MSLSNPQSWAEWCAFRFPPPPDVVRQRQRRQRQPDHASWRFRQSDQSLVNIASRRRVALQALASPAAIRGAIDVIQRGHLDAAGFITALDQACRTAWGCALRTRLIQHDATWDWPSVCLPQGNASGD